MEVPPAAVRRIELPFFDVAPGLPAPVLATVVRGARPGPRVFLTAGVHGDELNGIDIVRRVCRRLDPEGLAGTLVCVPIVNVPGFLNRSRYLPDGTDLNRAFPGSPRGAPAERYAHRLLHQVVRGCDYGIDFHTAGRGHLNVAHVRADMDRPSARTIARAFGTTIVVHRRGHRGSLRRVATEAGVPTIAMEAGQTERLERTAGESGVRGVRNVLVELGMLVGRRRPPRFQVVARRSVWVRAPAEGICTLAVRAGDLVYEGERIGSGTDPFGAGWGVFAPVTGLVIGVSLTPLCRAGDAICHVVRLRKTLPTVERHLQRRPGQG